MKSVLRMVMVGVAVLAAVAGWCQVKLQGGFSSAPIFALMHQPDVQKELGLSSAQIKSAKDAAGDAIFVNGNRVGLQITSDMDLDEMEARSIKILDGKQKTRLFEIYCQHQGMVALSHPMIADWAGFSAKNRKKLDAIAEGHQQEMMDLAMANGGRLDNQEHKSEMEQIKKRTEGKIKALMSAEELKSWEAKQGKKFDFKRK